MCQVNEVILGGIALDGRPWTHRGACNNAAMLEFNNTVCFIFMVIIYVSDTEFSIYTIYKISLKQFNFILKGELIYRRRIITGKYW